MKHLPSTRFVGNKFLMTVTLLTLSSQIHSRDLIKIDGSSTVFPITRAISDDFVQLEKGKTQVVVGITGTGGGFKKFCRGETDISNASRPIKEQEKKLCMENSVEFIELPVALDALTVVINKNNDWAESMSVKELKTAWQPESENKITSWNQLNPNYPRKPLVLYGPGTDSGTYDYFVNAVVGQSFSRRDYHPNEDDNVIVDGVVNDVNAMAFFGLAYFEENQERLKAVAISWKGSNPVSPNNYNARTGLYQPLSRPIFIYVNKKSAEKRKFVDRFVRFYLDKKITPGVVKEAGYVPLPPSVYETATKHFKKRITGSNFDGSEVGVSIEELLNR